MSNIFNNRLSVMIADGDMQTLRALINQMESNLPFLIGLTETERQSLPKINRQNKLFVDDALQALRSNVFLLPTYVNSNELEKDLVLFEQLSELEQLLTRLLMKVSHTRMLAGSEAYQVGLMFYRMAKAAAESGLPGAEAVADRLARRFYTQGPSGNGGSSPEPIPAPPASNGDASVPDSPEAAE